MGYKDVLSPSYLGRGAAANSASQRLGSNNSAGNYSKLGF